MYLLLLSNNFLIPTGGHNAHCTSQCCGSESVSGPGLDPDPQHWYQHCAIRIELLSLQFTL
jgi:hypothetical protein